MVKYQDLEKAISNQKTKGVILDFDQTLYNLKTNYIKLKEELVLFSNKKYHLDICFTPLEKVIAIKTEKPNMYLDLNKIITRYEIEGYNLGVPNNNLIKLIHNNRNKYAIYSMNSFGVIKIFLKDNHLLVKFDPIITQEKCSTPKPSNIELEKIVKTWGFDKSEVLFVGDSVKDRKSGEQAQIKTYIINPFPLQNE